MTIENLRLWLVKQLIGTTSIEKRLSAQYQKTLAFVVQKIAEDTQRYTNEYLGQALSEVDANFLSRVMNANKHLTEMQKSQIDYILRATPNGGAGYLG